MHVYISHGYLEDAARLASEYISAVLGTGKGRTIQLTISSGFGHFTELKQNLNPNQNLK